MRGAIPPVPHTSSWRCAYGNSPFICPSDEPRTFQHVLLPEKMSLLMESSMEILQVYLM
jgi:hypothetical protein